MEGKALRPYPWQRLPRLVQRIRYGQRDAAQRELSVLLEQFAQEHGDALAPLRLRCAMVLSYCLRGARLGGAGSESIIDQVMAAIDRLARARSRPSIERIMHQFVDQMLDHVVHREQTHLARAVARIQRDLVQDPARADSLKRYAADARLHPDYLSRQFKLATGQTFCEARRAARLKRARHLLIASSLLVGEVARRVGMRDASQFNRQFSGEFGMTPRRYRMQHVDQSVT